MISHPLSTSNRYPVVELAEILVLLLLPQCQRDWHGQIEQGEGTSSRTESSILFTVLLKLMSVHFMFTDAIRASDKSAAPDISSPIFYVAELDDNCNAVPLNLHWIIL